MRQTIKQFFEKTLLKHFENILRERTKPPNAKRRSRANNPNVFAMIMFLPAEPMNLNKAEAA